jgi:ribonucleotide monophosphatase NagD (HAD superfamily)
MSFDLLDRFSTLASRFDVVLCDIWGVVHNGLVAYPEACDALARYRAAGGAVILITNAPRPSPGSSVSSIGSASGRTLMTAS